MRRLRRVRWIIGLLFPPVLLLLSRLTSKAFAFTQRASTRLPRVRLPSASIGFEAPLTKPCFEPFVGGLVYVHSNSGRGCLVESGGDGESASSVGPPSDSESELLSLEEAKALLPAAPKGVGARRRADKEANWFKTYIYGPIDPRRKKNTKGALLIDSQKLPPAVKLLQLSEKHRPSGHRWKLLEDLRVGQEVLTAAEQAASETAQKLAKLPPSTKKKKRKLPAPVSVILRRAALRAAAEAVERQFLEEHPEEPALTQSTSFLDMLSGGLDQTETSQEEPKERKCGSSAKSGARRVYAQALRSLLARRRAELAQSGKAESISSFAVDADGVKERSGGEGAEDAKENSSSESEIKGESVSLLEALMPREGASLPYSAALLVAQLTAHADFDETIELHVQLKRPGSSSGSSGPRLQGFVTLPFGKILSRKSAPFAGDSQTATQPAPASPALEMRGKKRGGIWRRPRGIAVLTNNEEERVDALAAGADWVGAEEVGAQLEENPFAVDVLIATPEALASLGKHWKVVGSKKLTPTVELGTLTNDPVAAVRLYRQPTVQFVCDKFNVVHAPIGYVSLGPTRLLANFRAFASALKAAAFEARRANASRSAKLRNPPFQRLVESMYVCSTMGPGVKIDPRSV